MITALVDLGALDAFYQEHRLCGDLEGDVAGSWRTWARRSRKPSGRCCGWRLRPKGMSPKQRHGKTGMRLPMHLAKILGGLRRGHGIE